MRRPRHRADIQGLRGLAVLAVALYHLDIGVGGGFLGVDVFFVVSGFVICNLLQHELDERGAVDVVGFYARRARRLLPALAVFTVAAVGLTVLLTSPYDTQPFAFQTAGAALGFVANMFLYRHVGYFDGSAGRNPFLHLWSLSVEEQFYLVFPLLLLVGWRLARRRGMTLTVGLGLVASLAASLALTHGVVTLGVAAPSRLAYYAMPTRAWELLAGALLALQWHRTDRIGSRAAAVMGAVGLVAVLVETFVVRAVTADTAPLPVVAVIGTVLVIAAGAQTGPVTRLLSVRPLRTLGDWSYAWYLWHWPAIVFAHLHAPGRTWPAVLAAAAALVPAWASTRFVEGPARRRPATGPAALRLGTASLGIAFLAVAVGWSGAAPGWGVTVPLDWWMTAAGRESGCTLFNRDAADQWHEDACTTTVADQRGTVLILGDQHADSVSTGVVDAAHELGYGTAVWDRTDCPLSGATPVNSPRCRAWNADALALVDRLRPAAVVVANQSTAYLDPRGDTAITLADGHRPRSRQAAVTRWRQGFTTLLDELRRRDVAVVAIGPIPDHGDAFPRDRVSVLTPDIVAPTLTRRAFDAERAAVVAAERAAVRERDGTRNGTRMAYVDPTTAFCDATTCRTVDERGRWWYYQGRYLNRLGGRQLVRPVAGALRTVLGLGSSG